MVPLEPVATGGGTEPPPSNTAPAPDGGVEPGTPGAGGATPTPPDGGGSAIPDPLALAPRCSSGTQWTGGNRESPLMQPGEACASCHTMMGEGPKLAIAGTVYPTGHEPSQCYGADGTRAAMRAQVVVTDVSGRTVTANVNAAGNFFLESRTALTPPLKAKVVLDGRERSMVTATPSGDCNTCHTQTGTTTIAGGTPAPGRIVLP